MTVPTSTQLARAGAQLQIVRNAAASFERHHLGAVEARWQTEVLQWARHLGWLAYHTHDSRRSQGGYPDLTLVHRAYGWLALVELKRSKPKSYPTREQRDWLNTLDGVAGLDVAVWRPEHATAVVDYLIDPRTIDIPNRWTPKPTEKP